MGPKLNGASLRGTDPLCQKALATAKKVASLAEAVQTLKHEEQRPQTEHAAELKKTFGRSTGKAQQLVASWRNLVSKAEIKACAGNSTRAAPQRGQGVGSAGEISDGSLPSAIVLLAGLPITMTRISTWKPAPASVSAILKSALRLALLEECKEGARGIRCAA
jgi:hypothetical protein